MSFTPVVISGEASEPETQLVFTITDGEYEGEYYGAVELDYGAALRVTDAFATGGEPAGVRQQMIEVLGQEGWAALIGCRQLAREHVEAITQYCAEVAGVGESGKSQTSPGRRARGGGKR
jgi:hypothetical protein